MTNFKSFIIFFLNDFIVSKFWIIPVGKTTTLSSTKLNVSRAR